MWILYKLEYSQNSGFNISDKKWNINSVSSRLSYCDNYYYSIYLKIYH